MTMQLATGNTRFLWKGPLRRQSTVSWFISRAIGRQSGTEVHRKLDLTTYIPHQIRPWTPHFFRFSVCHYFRCHTFRKWLAAIYIYNKHTLSGTAALRRKYHGPVINGDCPWAIMTDDSGCNCYKTWWHLRIRINIWHSFWLKCVSKCSSKLLYSRRLTLGLLKVGSTPVFFVKCASFLEFFSALIIVVSIHFCVFRVFCT